ncbi:MAG: UDP-N-acetylglucosamine 2-epimerase (non-hydrolyzing) [Oscillospiraceae bacterium]|nr:UDP-N-acetylglucosamine 2-epimerase (non-hydrolyzing) [Oscillospiraceae bacterium]
MSRNARSGHSVKKPPLNVILIFGTRPDAVKMAPLVLSMKADKRFRCTVCVTGQHREMLDQVLTIFDIVPDYDLNIMREGQSLQDITSKVMYGVSDVFSTAKPDLALVHGDTTTCFAAALAAFYCKVPVGHVEAGLRTDNIYYPFPEEVNRRLAAAVSTMHFAPTAQNRQNLLREGVPDGNIYVTGNTSLDALRLTAREKYSFANDALNKVDFAGRRVLTVETHRRENLGEPLNEILRAVQHILELYPDMFAVFSVHLNPKVQAPVRAMLSDHDRALLLNPLCLPDYHNLVARSFLALSDSGGIQEEGPSLGTPVLVLRAETERQEAVDAGTVRLVGTTFDGIVGAVRELADDPGAYNAMLGAKNPYGDGEASARILDAIAERFELN